MTEIPLLRGLVALVDDADYEIVTSDKPWHSVPGHNTSYAVRGMRRPDGSWFTQRLHNFLTGWPYVDHVNGDGLDNRRCNLRPADASQNIANSRLRRDSTSGFKGVHWKRQSRKWCAQIAVRGERHHLGYFDDPVEAARAYDAAAVEFFGEFARLNMTSAGVQL